MICTNVVIDLRVISDLNRICLNQTWVQICFLLMQPEIWWVTGRVVNNLSKKFHSTNHFYLFIHLLSEIQVMLVWKRMRKKWKIIIWFLIDEEEGKRFNETLFMPCILLISILDFIKHDSAIFQPLTSSSDLLSSHVHIWTVAITSHCAHLFCLQIMFTTRLNHYVLP